MGLPITYRDEMDQTGIGSFDLTATHVRFRVIRAAGGAKPSAGSSGR